MNAKDLESIKTRPAADKCKACMVYPCQCDDYFNMGGGCATDGPNNFSCVMPEGI